MTTYTTLTDTALSQDKPVTQSMMRALRDNPKAISEGDSSAPQVEVKAVNSGAFAAATVSGGATLTNGAVVPFSVEAFDQNSWFNNSTYRYIPQKPGLYLIAAYVLQGSGGTATGGTYTMRKNGTAIGPVASIGAANVADDGVTTLVYLNGSTDYVDVIVNFSGGSLIVAGGGSNYLRGCLAGYAP